MINMETIIKAKRLYYKQGFSTRQIAKQLNINRRTVTKYLTLETTESPTYTRSKQHYPALGHFVDSLQQSLQQQSELPTKERMSAQRHYESLQSFGYSGSYSAVRRFVAAFYAQCPSSISIDAFVPLSFEPADAYQFDWSTETVKLGGKICKLQLAQFRLCHSRAFFLRCYLKQSSEMFIDAHNHAFTFFGGVPERGIYDNLKTAVSKVLKGKERIFNDSFYAMMGHFYIEPVACTPGAGWEKGQVERQVSIYRKRFFEPILSFASLNELNSYLLEQCLADMGKRKHPQFKQQTVAEIFEEEKIRLNGNIQPYPYYRSVHVAVNSYSLVNFEGNRYSVPCSLVGKRVTLHIRLDTVQIVNEHEVIAEHARIWEKGQTAYNPWHYLPLLKRKPGALRNGEPFKHWPLPEAIKKLQKHLMKQPKGDRTMVEILTLIAEYGEEVGVTAAELALECGMPTVAAVQNIINRLNEPIVPKFNVPDIPLFIPPETDLTRYNIVLKQVYEPTTAKII